MRSPHSAHFSLGVRANNAGMLCRLCMKKMDRDEVYVTIRGGMGDSNAHRVCLKKSLEWSLEELPLTELEIAADPTGHLYEVELARLTREFAEYRQELLLRYAQ